MISGFRGESNVLAKACGRAREFASKISPDRRWRHKHGAGIGRNHRMEAGRWSWFCIVVGSAMPRA